MTSDIELDLAKIAIHESLLIFDEFDQEMALKLGLVVRDIAMAQDAAVVIDIRRNEDCLFFYAMPGTTNANADWARRKRNLVNVAQKSSYALQLEHEKGFKIVEFMALNPRDYVPAGGCFPIRVAGAGMVGTATISGLPSRDDHRLISNSIAALLNIDLGDAAF
jgi:uncharacterized protein (UPF0303 family)